MQLRNQMCRELWQGALVEVCGFLASFKRPVHKEAEGGKCLISQGQGWVGTLFFFLAGLGLELEPHACSTS
jgi:hypothetical protein